MTRLAAGQPIVVRPSNNIYTVLTGVALFGALVALALVMVRGSQLGISWFAV